MLEQTPFEAILDERSAGGLGGRWYGVYPALVTEIANDPDNLGRVKVTLPWAVDAAGAKYEAWARVATLMAGKDRGSWFIPDKNDEVLVAFQGGDPRLPYVLGGLWNGKDAPPESMDGGGQNNKKVLKSRNGIVVTLDDSQGQEKLTLETPKQQKLVLQDGPNSIELSDANGNSIKLDASGVTIKTSAKVTIQAGAQVAVSTAMVNVDAAMSKFSGVVKADTAIATAVVGTSYTPGAGNIW